MTLTEYRHKRNFDTTPEPSARKRRQTAHELSFVVQEHHASHLHFDFRLEVDGVLKSWAVPKGPSMAPGVRRLAVHVEDHPYDYRTFEGEIPEGNYGAGTVYIWDEGTYYISEDKGSFKQAFEKGNIHFYLEGKKLKGEFSLIHNPSIGEKNWLLIKKDDEYADKDYELELIESNSKSNKFTSDLIEGLPSSDPPTDIKPMLASLVEEPFDSEQWLYEIKWDGYRAVSSFVSNKVNILSRRGIALNEKYRPICEAMRSFNNDVVVDGEIVVLDENGKARFEWLQNYKSDGEGHLMYCVFDILWCNGHDLTQQTLEIRRKVLEDIFPKHPHLLLSEAVEEQGGALFEAAVSQGLEGIVAKKKSSRYSPNSRSKQWLKIKTSQRQEVVIGGYTEPRGSRQDIGALLVGVYNDDQFTYVGHVGTGLPRDTKSLLKKLKENGRKTSPFSGNVKPNDIVHWLNPALVCEVKFSEWTNAEHMRHPVFMGLREDKLPKNVIKENPIDVASTELDAVSSTNNNDIKITNKDKVFFPDFGYTKNDLYEYYSYIRELMLPYIQGRPHSLLRHPNGYAGQSFFQKDMPETTPENLHTVCIYSESADKDINYLVVDSFKELSYMVQLGCIEINPWNSKIDSIENPDWIVMDIDPHGKSFEDVVKVALEIKKICDDLNISTFPKTSGKSGMHIYLPTGGSYNYDQIKQFAEILANLTVARLPELTTVARPLKKRNGRIYIDFLQNRRGQTLAAPYSVRPTKTANVSTPLSWEEVDKKIRPEIFNLSNIRDRIEQYGDIWAGFFKEELEIGKILEELDTEL